MFHLIVTACLAASSPDCAPVLLPEGDAPDRATCEADAARIAQGWMARHADLRAAGTECVANADLPAAPLQEIAPGVHVQLGEPVQMEQSANGRIANLGLVIGETVAVIDAGTSRAEGQALYVALRRLTDRPVSHLVLTHLHPDHIFGAGVFAEAGAEIVAHAALPGALAVRGPVYLQNVQALYPPAEWIGTEIPVPDRLVAGTDWLELGGRALFLTAHPPAHSESDLTAHDTAAGVLFAGDLVFRQLAPVVDGSLPGWLDWLAAPPRPQPRLIVPGHGPVAQGWDEAVAPQRHFLEALAASVRQQIASAVPMSLAVEAVADALSPLSTDWSDFDATVRRNATAAYKELEWE